MRLELKYLFVTIALSGCSLNGNFILHNASSETVILRLTDEAYESREYVVEAGESGNLRFNFGVDNEVSAKIGEKRWCYQVKILPSEWIKASLSGPKVYANLSPEWGIYIYPKESEEDSFYNEVPPKQPVGYPLEPMECLRR